MWACHIFLHHLISRVAIVCLHYVLYCAGVEILTTVVENGADTRTVIVQGCNNYGRSEYEV